MERWFWIGIGGAAGTLARYGLSTWCQQRFGADFPYGTLAVNVLGSFLLGAIGEIAAATELLSPTLRLGLSTGVMGGFTTYSSFNNETLRLIQYKTWAAGLANIVITLVGCLLAGVLGMVVARRLVAS
ncbi:camphor resistance protein CrcB [Sorangium cellulosum]|uniref:Fluoride-specific ion channel FluC n=1 Tax=Sorangium cellulosum TaxID=56 RepID=A0A4P2PZJ9_SORCE|nr:fluoride efflux transporter CrcB [Sorangium cellulosum]AUX22335.1 camphor resistance protein CrcB [Sorangium cellulosum]